MSNNLDKLDLYFSILLETARLPGSKIAGSFWPDYDEYLDDANLPIAAATVVATVVPWILPHLKKLPALDDDGDYLFGHDYFRQIDLSQFSRILELYLEDGEHRLGDECPCVVLGQAKAYAVSLEPDWPDDVVDILAESLKLNH